MKRNTLAKYFGFIIVLLILLINVSYANNEYDSKSLGDMIKTLLKHQSNILAIANWVKGSDKESALNIHESVGRSILNFSYLVDLEFLRNGMENTKDKETVKALIHEHLENLKADCKTQLTHFNIEIQEQITTASLGDGNSALLNETQHTRDDVVQACELIQNWK